MRTDSMPCLARRREGKEYKTCRTVKQVDFDAIRTITQFETTIFSESVFAIKSGTSCCYETSAH